MLSIPANPQMQLKGFRLIGFFLFAVLVVSASQAQTQYIDRWRDRQDLAYVRTIDSVIWLDLTSIGDHGDFPSISDSTYANEVRESRKKPRIFIVEASAVPVTYDDIPTLLDTDIAVRIEKAQFRPRKHKLGWVKEGDSRPELFYIDGKPFYGTDGEVPHRLIKSLALKVRGKKFAIPKHAYSDLYEPNLDMLTVYLSPDKSRAYIMMMNSDGAGAYGVTWCFREGRYIRRIVEYGW
jgi:hypothetical protein